jgi:hypothetical protein
LQNDITSSTIEKDKVVKVKGNAGGGNILLNGKYSGRKFNMHAS